MTSLKHFLVFFSIFNIHMLHEVHGGTMTYNFLRRITSQYCDWLEVGNHDPSPASDEVNLISAHNEFGSISCELSNRYAIGHSKNVTLVGDPLLFDLTKGDLEFYITYLNVSFIGNFKGDGAADGNPFSSEGSYFISYDSAYQFVKISGFSKSWNDFIDVSKSKFISYMGIYEDTKVSSYFEGLFDNVQRDYKDMLRAMLEEEFIYLLFDYKLHNPLSQLMKTYLQEIFDKTPLSEINATVPPSTKTHKPLTP